MTDKIMEERTHNRFTQPKTKPILKGCIVYNMPQRSDEWFEVKKGRLSASESGAWLINTDKRSIGAREKVLCKKLAEAGGFELAPIYESWAMTRGTNLEEQAVEQFYKERSHEVEEIGFIASKLTQTGCSPDGWLSGTNIGFEGKAPIPDTHIRYILDPPALLATYKWQVEHSLAVTGAEGWYLQSYCPGLPTVRHYVEPSDMTKRLQDAFVEFTELYKAAQKLIDEAYLKWRKI